MSNNGSQSNNHSNNTQEENTHSAKFSSYSDNDISIERCSHDKENPYTMVHNNLIRDESICPNTRWLIIYLLSNKDGWKISVQQVINHLKLHMGKAKVYELFDKAIEAGYMKKEDIFNTRKEGGKIKSGVKYIISESPKFKKFNRLPEIRDAGDRDAGKSDTKNDQRTDNDYVLLKNDIVSPQPSPFLAEAQQDIVSFNPKTYKLKNGESLTDRMQGACFKYMKDPISYPKLLRNLQYYEEYTGIISHHEKFLQNCLNEDYGNKQHIEAQNDLLARLFKEENKLSKMEILKSVVRIKKGDDLISVKKSLPMETFAANLQSFLRA